MTSKFDRFLEYFLALLMLIMLLSVTWQVVTRYFLGDPSSFTDELARYLLIWIGILGGAYAAGQSKNLAIDLLPNKLKGVAKFRLNVFINLIIIFFAVSVMVLGGSRLVYITYTLGQTSAAMQIPLAYVYIILPLSGLLITWYKIRDILQQRAELETQNHES